MSFIPFSRPGILSANDEVELVGPSVESNVVYFAPSVNVAPTGQDLVVRVQDGPGILFFNYIEARIPAGATVAVPVAGVFPLPALASLFIRVISGPTGGNAASFLTGYVEVTDSVSIGPLEDVHRTSFERLVSRTINRGTQFDMHIPGAVRRSIRFLENGNNFPYMRRILSWYKDPLGNDEQKDPVVELGQYIKRLDSVRRFTSSNLTARKYTYITGVGLDDVSEMKEAVDPEFYYTTYGAHPSSTLAGNSLLLHLGVLSFSSAFTLEVCCYQYTNYSELPIFDDHWLFSAGESVVLAQTMLNLAPIIRQPEIISLWAPVLAMGLPNLLAAADDMDIDQHAQQMGYGGLNE